MTITVGGDPSGSKVRSAAIAVAFLAFAVTAVILLATQPWKSDRPAPDASARTITLPASVDGYLMAPSTEVQSAVTELRSNLAGGKLLNDQAQIGMYRLPEADHLSFYVAAMSARDNGELSKALHEREPAAVISLITQFSNLIETKTYPTAPLDGELRCGRVIDTESGKQASSVCLWAGKSTVGVVVSVNDPITPAKLAGVTQALRVSGEH